MASGAKIEHSTYMKNRETTIQAAIYGFHGYLLCRGSPQQRMNPDHCPMQLQSAFLKKGHKMRLLLNTRPALDTVRKIHHLLGFAEARRVAQGINLAFVLLGRAGDSQVTCTTAVNFLFKPTKLHTQINKTRMKF